MEKKRQQKIANFKINFTEDEDIYPPEKQDITSSSQTSESDGEPFWVLPSLTQDCLFSSLLFSPINDTHIYKYLITTFQNISNLPPLYPYYSPCVALMFLLLLSGTSPVYVRYLFAYIPNIYRTSTGYIPDMYRSYSLVVSLFHWDCVLDK